MVITYEQMNDHTVVEYEDMKRVMTSDDVPHIYAKERINQNVDKEVYFVAGMVVVVSLVSKKN